MVLLRMKSRNICVSFVFVMVLSFKDSQSCFTYNQVQDITIKAGSSFYHECLCLDPKSSIDNLKWLDIHGQEINTLEPGMRSHLFSEIRGRSISLHIPSMSKTMSGVYKCTANHNGKNYTHAFNIVAYDPLYFINTSENQYLINGKDSLITCEARGETNPLITWHKGQDDFTEIVTDEKYDKISVGLVIKNVTNDDTGLYKCTASVLETSEEVDRYIKVKVLTLPKIKELKANPERTVVEGTTLSIECIADGVPHPEYRWNKTSNANSDNMTWYQESNTIVFNRIEADDRGNYECVAYNDAGETRQQIKVEVLYPPTIQVFENITAVEGSTVQIVCKAKGRPRPKISILFDVYDPEETGVVWDKINTSETETTFTLTYMNVSRKHEGIYTCNASNEVESELEDIKMTVLYKPYFAEQYELIWGWHGKTINLSCNHESNPSSNVSWRYHGNEIKTDVELEINKIIMAKVNKNQDLNLQLQVGKLAFYGLYECIAKNEIGESKKIIALRQGFAPQEIRDVLLVNLTATTAMFSIDGPEIVEGPPVLGYTAAYDEADNYNFTNIHNNRTWSIDRPYKIEKLRPNTTYYIKFAAINAVGEGLWTKEATFNTPEKSIPDTPAWLEQEVIDSEVKDQAVKWKAPEENGDPIDYYIIKNCPVEDEEIVEKLCVEEKISKEVTKFDLGALKPNTTYYLELVAHNSEGNSSVAETYITMPASRLQASIRLPVSLLSAEAVIGISVVVVFLCLVTLDVMLLLWKKQGIIASCVYRKRNKKNDDAARSRDKKGLLKETSDKNEKRSDDKEFEYNRPTGVIIGKHSSV